MKRWLAVAALLVAAGVVFWLRSLGPSPTVQTASPPAVSTPTVSPSSPIAGVPSTNQTPVTIEAPVLEMANVGGGVKPLPAPGGMVSPTLLSRVSPVLVLEQARRAVRQYGAMFNGNPVGNNLEITRALNGGNPKQVNFIPADSGLRTNEKGEMIDPWGTPYFFHQLSGTEMEVRSAGPDGIMWTADDVVAR